MNKLEDLYDSAIKKCMVTSFPETCPPHISEDLITEKAVEITTDVTIKFAEWISRNTYVFDGSKTMNTDGEKIGIAKGKKYCRIDYTVSENNSGWTTQELFEEFITNHYTT